MTAKELLKGLQPQREIPNKTEADSLLLMKLSVTGPYMLSRVYNG